MSAAAFEITRPASGHGQIVEADGDHVVFQSTVPTPPGSTLECSSGDVRVLIKVRSCKRASPGDRFRIEGRFVNLSRTDREKLSLDRPA
jgi:hypothetical protein